MGGKKRHSTRDDNHLLKKIRKLEEKVRRTRRHRKRSTSESSESIIDDNEPPNPIDSPTLISDNNDLEVNSEILIDNQTQSQPELVDGGEECSELNPDILNILGDDSCAENVFSENLHKDVSTRWQHILLNGLSKENRSELLKKYLPPENCPNMRAPKLNLEIKAALTEINNKKDLYSQTKQNQLASCLSALGKALNMSITKSKDDLSQQEIIQYLSDASRLLCDYHYKESQSRRYAIINTLNKQTRDTIKNTKIDEYLFGSGLAEHLKSSKAISKSGQELRPKTDNRPKLKAVTTGQTSTARRGTLNARGAPQAPAAETRANPAPRRNHAAPAPATTRHRNNYSSKYTQRQRGRRT